MILSPKSLSKQRLSNASLDILSARLTALPQINLLCDLHKEIPQHICLHEHCTKPLLCSRCVPLHSQNHKSSLASYDDTLGSNIIQKIDQEITFNLLIEQRNDIYLKYLEQVKLAIDDIRKRIDKTLTSIFASIKDKAFSCCIDPLYPTSEWDKLKKSLLEKKISLAKADNENQVKFLSEYLQVFLSASRTLADVETTKELKNPVDPREIFDPPELEQEYVDESIKLIRRILEDFSSKISLQVSSLNSPEENMRRTQNFIPQGNNPNLSSRVLNTYRRPKTNGFEVASKSSIVPTANKIQDNTLSTNRAMDLARHKSLNPQELVGNKIPQFLYDEHLETEVINLPYVGPAKIEDDVIYRGQMNQNKRHGKGKQTWKDGRVYEGYFKDDRIEGKGRMVHPDHEIYEGQWVNGKAHGKGKYIKPDGWVFEGDWLNDQIHGKGIETWPDGSIYEGEFEKGVKNGKGTLIGPDGSCYSGNFKNNVFHGEGKYIWIDGKKYEGKWVNNLREGKGVMTWPDGKKYDGEFYQDKREGFGRFEWGDGRKYLGCWKDGKMHGQGKLQGKDGKIVEGEWKEGKMITNNMAITFEQSKSMISFDNGKDRAELKTSRLEGRKSQFSEKCETKETGNPARQSFQGSKIQNNIKEDDKNPEEKDDAGQKDSLGKTEDTKEKRSSININL